MGPLAIDMYLPALPSIARDLHTCDALVQVSLAVYFVGIALRPGVLWAVVRSVGPQAGAVFRPGAVLLASVGCALARDVGAHVDRLPVPAGARRMRAARRPARPSSATTSISAGSVRMLSVLMLVMGLAPDSGAARRRPAARHLRLALDLLGARGLRVGLAPGCCTSVLPESLAVGAPPAAADRRGAGHLRPAAPRSRVHGPRPRRCTDLRRTARLHLRLAVRLHRAVSRAAGEIRHLLRRQRDRHHDGVADQPMAGAPLRRRHRFVAASLPVSLVASVALVVDAATGFGGFAGILVPLFFYIACTVS